MICMKSEDFSIVVLSINSSRERSLQNVNMQIYLVFLLLCIYTSWPLPHRLESCFPRFIMVDSTVAESVTTCSCINDAIFSKHQGTNREISSSPRISQNIIFLRHGILEFGYSMFRVQNILLFQVSIRRQRNSETGEKIVSSATSPPDFSPSRRNYTLGGNKKILPLTLPTTFQAPVFSHLHPYC